MITAVKRIRKMLVPFLMSIGSLSYASQNPANPLLNAVSNDSVKVFDRQGNQLSDEVTVKIHRQGNFLRTSLQNDTDKPLQIKEVVLLDIEHGWPGESAFYGEGFTMLSQTAGRLAEMRDVGKYTDKRHYRLAAPTGFRTVYGMMRVTPPDAETTVLGFTSCRRFVGQFDISQTNLRVVIDTEGLTLKPQEQWELEEFAVFTGSDADIMLKQLAQRLSVHHPRLAWPQLPTGWCSWYCFGPKVTAQNIADNIDQFKQHLPQIRYIQIDDGYQPWMGDWLEPKEAFGGNVKEVIAQIRQSGFEPAIWVAPFIASPQSKLFKEHPDWFVKDDQGKPLRSDKVTFGGWRLGPWYMLDGTQPEAQQYLEHVFSVMREEWGCTYFKLDANAWGAMPFGRRYDPSASSVQAYREGMAAVRRGAGKAFLLGCNHPIWPSIGEIHGSRSSSDIHRSWKQFRQVADENLFRNWQNQRLWWNDPDCLALANRGRLPANEQLFHATSVYASGGMLLSGDDVTQYEPWQWDILKKAAANPGIAATFENNKFEVGILEQDGQKRAVFLNWSDQPERRRIPLDQPCRVVDFWENKELGSFTEEFLIEDFPARSGGIYVLEPVAPRPADAGTASVEGGNMASMAPAPIPAVTPENFLKRSLSPQVLVDPDYFIWGLSALRWKDGKVHVYYSRWPKRYGFGGWMTHCEIAHAVADRPEGPFHATGTVIESRHLDGWDIINAHNPSVCVAEGKIHLYYISNRLRGEFEATDQQPFPSDRWLVKNRGQLIRNRQCIGVASADNPAGPFVRSPQPVVVPHGRFKNIAVNPAVAYHDGKFVMIMKGDDIHREGWFRIQLVGHADKAEGPFVFQEAPIYDKEQTEDACIWHDRSADLFHSLVHVMGRPVLAGLVSEDGVQWREAEPFTFMHKQFALSDGSTWKPQRVERPFVLTDKKGRAEWLYLAVLDKGISGNIAVSLKAGNIEKAEPPAAQRQSHGTPSD